MATYYDNAISKDNPAGSPGQLLWAYVSSRGWGGRDAWTILQNNGLVSGTYSATNLQKELTKLNANPSAAQPVLQQINLSTPEQIQTFQQDNTVVSHPASQNDTSSTTGAPTATTSSTGSPTTPATNDGGKTYTTPDGKSFPTYTAAAAYISQGGTTGGTGVSSSGPTSTTGQGIAYNPAWAQRGITQAAWNSLNANQQATMGATLDAASAIVSNTGSSVTLADALKAAAADPNIIAKYSDAFALDTQAFTQTLAQIHQATALSSQTNQMQFEADRKALAEQSAAAGQAYSGFRNLAQQNLATTESGIVQSSRSALQQKLNDATTAFEGKYGTSSTIPASSTFVDPNATANVSISGLETTGSTAPETLTGALAGGITGTQPIQKAADINALAAQDVSLGAIPKVIQP